MELVARTITGTLEDAFGEPLTGVKITFIPKRVFGANGVTIPAQRREVLTDESGGFSADLYTFAEASVAYECLLPSKELFTFNLAAGDAITLEDLRQISVLESNNSQGFLEDLIREIIEEDGAPASGPAGGVLSGSYPNPGFAVNMAEQSELDQKQNLLISGTNIKTINGEAVTGAGNINAGLGVLPAFPGHYPNPKMPSGLTNNSIVGNNDLYTVPAGRKALIFDYTVTNSTAGSINHYPQIKIGGTYFQIGNAVTEGSGGTGRNYGMSSQRQSAPILLNAGESFAVNTDAAGLSIWAHIIEFDASAPLSRATITNFVAGNNILLTVSAGKTAVIGSQGFTSTNNPNANLNGIVYYNTSGSTRTMGGIYLVANGDTPVNSNCFEASNSIFSGLGFTKFFAGGLPPLMQIVINSDSNAAGQIAWCNYQEF